jgi:hypothetical protein
MEWWVENDSRKVRFRGAVDTRDDLEKVIAALSAQIPLLPVKVAEPISRESV